MYLKENIRKLKEIGLTDREIDRIRKSRWILEHCKPHDIFLLKIAYMVKTERPPSYEVIEGGRRAVEHFEKRFRTMIDIFSSECGLSAKNFMKTHFEEFVYTPGEQLDWCHFKVLMDFLLTFKKGPRIIYSLVDFEAKIFETPGAFLYTLYMNDCGVMWISRGKRMWFFAGPLVEGNFKEMIKKAREFADRIFGSEWWEKLSGLISLVDEVGPSFREYAEKVEKLKEIRDWLSALSEVEPALLKVKKVPADFTSQITTFYTYLLEEYLKM